MKKIRKAFINRTLFCNHKVNKNELRYLYIANTFKCSKYELPRIYFTTGGENYI